MSTDAAVTSTAADVFTDELNFDAASRKRASLRGIDGGRGGGDVVWRYALVRFARVFFFFSIDDDGWSFVSSPTATARKGRREGATR